MARPLDPLELVALATMEPMVPGFLTLISKTSFPVVASRGHLCHSSMVQSMPRPLPVLDFCPTSASLKFCRSIRSPGWWAHLPPEMLLLAWVVPLAVDLVLVALVGAVLEHGSLMALLEPISRAGMVCRLNRFQPLLAFPYHLTPHLSYLVSRQVSALGMITGWVTVPERAVATAVVQAMAMVAVRRALVVRPAAVVVAPPLLPHRRKSS